MKEATTLILFADGAGCRILSINDLDPNRSFGEVKGISGNHSAHQPSWVRPALVYKAQSTARLSIQADCDQCSPLRRAAAEPIPRPLACHRAGPVFDYSNGATAAATPGDLRAGFSAAVKARLGAEIYNSLTQPPNTAIPGTDDDAVSGL